MICLRIQLKSLPINQDRMKRDKRSPIPQSATVSKRMGLIKGTGNKLETSFRKLLYKKGARGYKVNFASLPGKPDIAFLKKKKVVFIHGCFWHGCEVCGRRIPKYNTGFWHAKIYKTIERDQKNLVELQKLGFQVLEIWEHEIKNDLNSMIIKTMGFLKV